MARSKNSLFVLLITLFCGVGATGFKVAQAEDYSFNLDEFEKKALSWGGYAEVKGEHFRLNHEGASTLLAYYDEPNSDLDRVTTTLQFDGNYHKGMADFNWLIQAFSASDQVEYDDNLQVFSAYASIKPTPSITFELGKKTFKWGKGYAWNPVAFIDRPKNPSNPDDALEGYIGVAADLIKSLPGKLQTVALTTVLLPVWGDVNDDFGAADNLNIATKLYLLYRDTDIDFIVFSGNSRSTRFGVDISRNLTTNFEVHAELAHIPEQKMQRMTESGDLTVVEQTVTTCLAGLRYLTANDITTILEYYHNDAGYSEEQMDRFYDVVYNAYDTYLSSGDDSRLRQIRDFASKSYAKPQSGRNYLYLRMTQKEPFDLLYFTPGVTAIMNIDDSSYTLSPEVLFTGFTNWELRFRYSHLEGGRFTEQGEKINDNKIEMRIRYFF